MRSIEVSRRVDAPAPRVWELIVDLDNAPAVISGIQRIEVLSGPTPLAEGTTWLETRHMFGREATAEMTVTSLVPGRSYSTRASDRGVTYTSRLGVEPLGDGACQMSMSLQGQPTAVFSRIVDAATGWLFTSATRRAMAKDLDDIAAAAEAGPTT